MPQLPSPTLSGSGGLQIELPGGAIARLDLDASEEQRCQLISWRSPLWISRTALAVVFVRRTVAKAKTSSLFVNTANCGKLDPKWRCLVSQFAMHFDRCHKPSHRRSEVFDKKAQGLTVLLKNCKEMRLDASQIRRYQLLFSEVNNMDDSYRKVPVSEGVFIGLATSRLHLYRYHSFSFPDSQALVDPARETIFVMDSRAASGRRESEQRHQVGRLFHSRQE